MRQEQKRVFTVNRRALQQYKHFVVRSRNMAALELDSEPHLGAEVNVAAIAADEEDEKEDMTIFDAFIGDCEATHFKTLIKDVDRLIYNDFYLGCIFEFAGDRQSGKMQVVAIYKGAHSISHSF